MAAAKLRTAGVEPVIGDLGDEALLAQWAGKTDGTIHMAMAHTAEYASVDAKAVRAMLGALEGSGKKFVYTSGTWGWGDDKGGVITEETPESAETSIPFVKHRVDLEREIRAQGRAHNVQVIVIRPVVVLAKGHSSNGMYLRLAAEQAYIGDGEQYLSFVHARDLGPFYLAAFEKAPGVTTYIAYSTTLRLREVLAQLGFAGPATRTLTRDEAFSQFSVYGYAAHYSQHIASTKAFTELGFKPKYTSIHDLFNVE